MANKPSRRLLLIEGKDGGEITKISVDRSNWTAEQWEELLSDLDVPLAESQISPRDYDHLAEQQITSVFALADNEAPERLQFLIELHVNCLSPREREVVRAVFWNGETNAEIATRLELSISTVADYRDSALKKLKAKISKDPLALPFMKGPKRKGGQDD